MEEKITGTFVEMSDEKGPKVKRHRGVVLFLLLAGIFFGCFWLWRYLQRPAVGTTSLGALVKTEESFEKNAEKKHFSGKYVNFSYSAAYLVKRHETPTAGPIRESIFLSADDVEGRKIAVVVAKRETEDLMSEPSFQMRKQAPRKYDEKNLKIDPFQGVFFENKELPAELTFFLTHDGYITSISVSSPFGIEGLEEELTHVVQDLVFPLR